MPARFEALDGDLIGLVRFGPECDGWLRPYKGVVTMVCSAGIAHPKGLLVRGSEGFDAADAIAIRAEMRRLGLRISPEFERVARGFAAAAE